MVETTIYFFSIFLLDFIYDFSATKC